MAKYPTGVFLAGFSESSEVIISLVSTCLAAARGGSVSSQQQNLEHMLVPLLTNILGEAQMTTLLAPDGIWLLEDGEVDLYQGKKVRSKSRPVTTFFSMKNPK